MFGSLKSINNLDHSSKDYNLVLINNLNSLVRTCRKTLLRAIENEGSLEYSCAICCNKGFHLGLPLILQIDHIDGDWRNNEINNLRFLCPNCHSQTETYGFTGELKY